MKKLNALRNKKGFTLVEVIIVLVILAILAAVLIPSLVGYIDKANEKAAIANCRSFVMAAQTVSSEAYGERGALTTGSSTNDNNLSASDFFTEVYKLSELSNKDFKATVTMDESGKISEVLFQDTSYVVKYGKTDEKAAYTVTSKADATELTTNTLKIGSANDTKSF